MTGDGEVGLWGGYGEYMEIFAGHRAAPDDATRCRPSSSRCSSRWPTRVNWVDIVGVHEGDTVVVQGPGHQGLAVLEAVLAQRPAQVIVTGTSRRRAAPRRRAGDRRDRTWSMVDVDDAGELVDDLTGGAGADVVFDVATATADGPDGHRPRPLRRAASCSPG